MRSAKLKRTREVSLMFPLLPPGLYEVGVEAQGFRRALSRSFRIDVNQTMRLDFVLSLGPLSEQIVVNESPALVETDSSALGQVIEASQIQQLPLNERNFLAFALLSPGAQMGADGSQLSSQGGGISVDGAREQSNNLLIDGLDNNDSLINQLSVLPSADAIAEFKVQASNSNASFGRSAGAQINVVLKSGTNELHGSSYELLRNRRLDAKNFFDLPYCSQGSAPGSCADIPRLDRQQFGATLGGPVLREKLFFFSGYEALLLRQATTREATVPSQAQRSAALAAVPPGSQNPAGLAVFNLLPAANVGTNQAISNRFVSSPVIRDTTHYGVAKLDWVLRRTGTLSGHYSVFDDDRFNPFDPTLPLHQPSWIRQLGPKPRPEFWPRVASTKELAADQ
jgi:hypothetical protein